MRILNVYDAELDFFVSVITPHTAHEACATIHLTGGECNAQTCMHMQVIHRFYRNLDGLPLDPIKSQTNVWAAWPQYCTDGLRFGKRVQDAL